MHQLASDDRREPTLTDAASCLNGSMAQKAGIEWQSEMRRGTNIQ